jgi:hypothetical protein
LSHFFYEKAFWSISREQEKRKCWMANMMRVWKKINIERKTCFKPKLLLMLVCSSAVAVSKISICKPAKWWKKSITEERMWMKRDRGRKMANIFHHMNQIRNLNNPKCLQMIHRIWFFLYLFCILHVLYIHSQNCLNFFKLFF